VGLEEGAHGLEGIRGLLSFEEGAPVRRGEGYCGLKEWGPLPVVGVEERLVGWEEGATVVEGRGYWVCRRGLGGLETRAIGRGGGGYCVWSVA